MLRTTATYPRVRASGFRAREGLQGCRQEEERGLVGGEGGGVGGGRVRLESIDSLRRTRPLSCCAAVKAGG